MRGLQAFCAFCYPYILIRKCNYITAYMRRTFTFPICHTLYFLIYICLIIGVTYSLYIGTNGVLAISMGIDPNRAPRDQGIPMP
jgi:hypothetical protein